MDKVLMLASVASMIDQFNMDNIEILQKQGYEVHVAANFNVGNTSSQERLKNFKLELAKKNIAFYQVDFSRNITNILSNYKAYKQVIRLLEKNEYKFIHCHSPIGGVYGRLAANRTKTPIIYTAHGFHFFKGGPLKNWLLFYPVERLLAHYTDILITINQEDYKRAQRFKAKKVIYIPGVGVDAEKFKNTQVDIEAERMKLDIPKDAFLILSVGELNDNKNHETIIKAIAQIDNSDIYYVVCGIGPKREYLNRLICDLKLEDNVKLVGFRTNVREMYKIANIFAFPSYREGLGLAAIEAMASGLPLVTSNVHGINDYSVDGVTGKKCSPTDVNGFVNAIKNLYENQKMRSLIKENNLNKAVVYDKKNVNTMMGKIYREI